MAHGDAQRGDAGRGHGGESPAPMDRRTQVAASRVGTGSHGPLTIARWLALYESEAQEAGSLLLEVTQQAARGMSRQASERDDLAQEVVLRALADRQAALRRAEQTVPLVAWVRVCLRRVAWERRRSSHARSLTGGEPARTEPRRGGPEDAGDEERVAAEGADATPRQEEALRSWYQDSCFASVARKLAISPQAARDLLGRAARRSLGITQREANERSALECGSRDWADLLLADERVRIKADSRALLEAYRAGASRAQLAGLLGISKDAVRKRLSRMRRRLAAKPPEVRPGDGDPPEGASSPD